MKYGLGKQYHGDHSFKKKARLHQSKFRSEVLNVDYSEYGNRLTENDAKDGLNFHSGFDIIGNVNKRYPKYSKGLYADMLRSEHIPFNIFTPFNTKPHLAKNVFESFLPINILKIISVKIEYAPSPAKEYTNDRTAFDAFIEYMDTNNELGIIGIEVKYTEKEYKIKHGSKEEKDVLNKNSIYFQLTNGINLYHKGSIIELPKDNYRQYWRNQLLGESMLQHKDSQYSHFISVILYPNGNQHFTKISEEYHNFIFNIKKNKFCSITFEQLFKLIENNIDSYETKVWLEYLNKRYLI